MRKQHLAIGIYKFVRAIVNLSVFRHFFWRKESLFSENLSFRSQHTSCVSYYDNVIDRDVTLLA